MPSMQHEVLVELFRNRPTLAAELLEEAFGVVIPPYEEASVTSESVTEIQPAEYRADLVIKLMSKGKVVRGNVVEVQLSADPDKRYAWPAYLCGLREEHRCPVDLLVIAPDVAVAKWCEEPIEIGVPRFVLEPPVLKRDRIPKVTDAAEATRRPELALLSAMAYGDSGEVVEIGRAALAGFSVLDPQRCCFYTDILYNAINEAARSALEVKMQGYVFQSPFIVNYIEQQVAQGVERGIRERIDQALQQRVEQAVERRVEQAVQQRVEQAVQQRVEQAVQQVQGAALERARDEGLKTGRDEGLKTGRDEGLKTGRDEGLKAGRDEGLKAGRDEGFAEALVALLRARGFDIPQPKRDEILGEKNHARLQQWLERAVTATSLAEVFNEAT